MNASRLRELIDFLVQKDRESGAENLLTQLQSQVQQLAQNPQQPNFQQQVAATLDQIEAKWQEMLSSITPAEFVLLDEIGAKEYFAPELPAELRTIVQANAATLQTAREKINAIVSGRQSYMNDLRELSPRLDRIRVKPNQPPPGEAEIGVLIPHALFGGRLDEFVEQLATLDTVLRTLAEAVTGSAEEPEVRQISSTDPQIFLALSTKVAVAVAGVVTWALATWRQVEEIRKVRAETQKLKSFSEKEIEDIFSSKIKKEIDLAVDAKVKELLGRAKDSGRQKEEQATYLEWALRSILSRIERGMTIEIRFQPHSKGDERATKETAADFAALRAEAQQLKFPPPEPSPVLELPPPTGPKGTKRGHA